MSLLVFTVFTVAGSSIWNGVLVGLGAALGTQYEQVSRYSRFLNYAVYAVLAGLVVWLIIRRVRRRRRSA